MSGSNVNAGLSKPSGAPAARPLSAREREVLNHLADGLSGAAIARLLVLSPETVRTHVRNAMEKLGASTRSQAIALALERREIGDAPPATTAASSTVAPAAGTGLSSGPTLTALLAGVVALADVESGAIYSSEEGGMVLRIAAHASSSQGHAVKPPQPELALGDPGIGEVALEKRARLITVPAMGDAQAGPMLATPMINAGKLAGVLALGVRGSRPTSRHELLLLEAFGNRLADILVAGADPGALRSALSRFRASWTGALGS